jgi:hypothetical protein
MEKFNTIVPLNVESVLERNLTLGNYNARKTSKRDLSMSGGSL